MFLPYFSSLENFQCIISPLLPTYLKQMTQFLLGFDMSMVKHACSLKIGVQLLD
jgi:hypothetical protein